MHFLKCQITSIPSSHHLSSSKENEPFNIHSAFSNVTLEIAGYPASIAVESSFLFAHIQQTPSILTLYVPSLACTSTTFTFLQTASRIVLITNQHVPSHHISSHSQVGPSHPDENTHTQPGHHQRITSRPETESESERPYGSHTTNLSSISAVSSMHSRRQRKSAKKRPTKSGTKSVCQQL